MLNPVQKNSLDLLFSAQEKGRDALKTHYFPRYDSDTFAATCCNFVHDVLAVTDLVVGSVIWAVQKLALGVFSVADFFIGFAARPLLDIFYPLNPINNQRHFVGIPRSFEKFLGDNIFYPLATLGLSNTEKTLPISHRKIETVINSTVKALIDGNKELLNPSNCQTSFDYRMRTISSPSLNAFAAPGGGMVIYSELASELERAIHNQTIKETTILFDDGSKVTVDLRDVTLEDALASLIGHEMTHVASRHAMALIFESLARRVSLGVLKTLIGNALSNQDEKKKEKKEKIDSPLVEFIEDWADYFIRRFSSRKNEYEADVTGAYFANSAKFNPLGALYLQQFLISKSGGKSYLGNLTEFLSTHPNGDKRLKTLFAAISEFAPERLKGKTSWKIENKHNYDMKNASPAVAFASKTKELLKA